MDVQLDDELYVILLTSSLSKSYQMLVVSLSTPMVMKLSHWILSIVAYYMKSLEKIG